MTRTTLFCLLFLIGFIPTFHNAAQSERPSLVLQVGHANVVRSLAFSPDGKFLASGGDDNTVELWDTRTGRQVRSIKGHTRNIRSLPSIPDSVFSVSFSPDSKILASGGSDATAKLWDVNTGHELASLRNGGPVYSVCFSPDGKVLASTGETPLVKLWTVPTGQLLRTFDAQNNYPLTAVAFSPDGKLLASGSTDATIKIWDLVNGQQLPALKGHTDSVMSLAFSPDAKLLASGSDDRTAKLWNVTTGKELRTFPDHATLVNCLAFNFDGTLLASGSNNNTVKVWEASTGKLSYSVEQPNISSVAFSPDGKVMATAGFGKAGKTVSLWNLATHVRERALGGDISMAVSVAFSNDGKLLALGNGSGKVNIWDLITGRQVRSLSGNDYVYCVALSPDAKLLASGDQDVTVKLWDLTTGENIRSLVPFDTVAHTAKALAFSPDGKLLATMNGGGVVKLWDTATGENLRPLDTQADEPAIYLKPDVESVAFGPGGKILVSGGGSGDIVKVWDVTTGQEVRSFGQYSGSIALSSDGKLIASGQPLELWDTTTGQIVRRLGGPMTYAFLLAFQPDGKVLAAATGNTIKLWDVTTGQELLTLNGHTGDIRSLAFHPKGKVLASASDDNTVKLWDVSEGKELASLIPLNQSSSSLFQAGDWLVVAPDGLFDGTADAMRAVSWRNTNEVVPLESFFNDFYYPGLLEELLYGGRPRAVMDVATALRMPGLRLMFRQRSAGLSDRNGKMLLCFNEKPTAVPQVFSDAKPLVFDVDSLICDGADKSCVCHYELPSDTQLELVNASKPLGFEMAKPPYDGVKSETSRSTLHVQTIGVSTYDKLISGFRPLPSSVSGAKEIENFFWQEKGEPANPFRNIKVWPGLYDKDATTAKIRQRLAEMAKEVKEDDVLFLFLSGHGIVPAGQEMFYFASSDVRSALSNGEREMGLNTAMLAEAIREIPATRVVLIIDACQSGGALESLGKIVEVKLKAEQRRAQMERPSQSKSGHEVGIYLIAVATPLQEAVQPRIGYGALVTTLTEALRSDQQQSGNVWMRDLVKYIQLRLPEVSERIGQRHTPMIVSSGVDFALATRKRD